MNVRRVVTGHDSDGRAVIASDELVQPLNFEDRGTALHRVWGADRTPVFPDDGSLPEQDGMLAPVGGYRFIFFTLAPGGGPSAEHRSSSIEIDDDGMHRTDTVDLTVVLSGEVILHLDGGYETVLRAGDTLIQNGTRHRWENRGNESAVMATVNLGARRDTQSRRQPDGG